MRVLSYIGFLLAIGVTARCLDPYAVLGVEEGSTIADIKRAYRRLSLKYHPDHGAAGSSCGEIGEKDMAVEMGSESESMGGDDDVVATCSVSWGDVDESDAFRRITEAYGLLKEGNTRRLYDKYGQEWATMHEYLSKADALGLVEIYDDDRYAESRAGQARRLITILHDENWQRHLVPTSQLNGLDEDTISESSSPDTAEDDYWAVIFYHPEVRECIKNKQRYHQIASTMAKAGEKVRFGVINCAMSPDLCTRFAVDAYDTILVFDKHQMSTKYLNYYIWDLEPELLPTISDWVDKKNRLPVLLNGDDHLTWWLAHNRETHKASLSQPDAPPPQGDNRASIIIHFTRTCRPCQEILRYIEAMDHGPHSPQHILVDCTAGQCDAPYYPYIQLLPPKNDLPSPKHGPQSHEAIPIDYHFKRHPIELILNLVSTIYGNADS